jgi:lipopolysaccharide transport system ATP-binding protein
MINVNGITKSFKLYNSPADRLKEIFFRKKYHQQFTALKNVTFQLADKETLGIIGENGAGKSTILKILTGITIPDVGTIDVVGRVTGLLELGLGFNTELTGLENIYGNGTLLGMKRSEIDEKLPLIVDFAELGPFIKNSLKLYSSGMVMRLAFSVAIHADPQCFVVDEALSVGDAYFQQKCIKKIKQFKEDGGSIVFVSHDMNAVKLLCDKAILLEEGEIAFHGEPEQVINHYNYKLAKKQDQEHELKWDTTAKASYGTFEIRTTGVKIIGENSRTHILSAGELAHVIMEIESSIDLTNLTVGIDIRDKFGQIIFGTNTYRLRKVISVQKDNVYTLTLSIPMNVGIGLYTLSCALHTGITHEDHCFQWSDSICSFEVSGDIEGSFIGLCKLEPKIDFTSKE